jgi:hypothetical protein
MLFGLDPEDLELIQVLKSSFFHACSGSPQLWIVRRHRSSISLDVTGAAAPFSIKYWDKFRAGLPSESLQTFGTEAPYNYAAAAASSKIVLLAAGLYRSFSGHS